MRLTLRLVVVPVASLLVATAFVPQPKPNDRSCVAAATAPPLGVSERMKPATAPQGCPQGCTAEGVLYNIGGTDVVFWEGCPSNTCGVGADCQPNTNGSTWFCFCPDTDPDGPCIGKAVMDDTGQGIVARWYCVTNGCDHNCNPAPKTQTPGVPFYFCTCPCP